MYSEVSGEAGKVSIHASSREDATIEMPVYLCDLRFNPRVLAGGRDHNFQKSLDRYLFQSTRPRGRTRLESFNTLNATFVSIHASSREDATSSHL